MVIAFFELHTVPFQKFLVKFCFAFNCSIIAISSLILNNDRSLQLIMEIYLNSNFFSAYLMLSVTFKLLMFKKY